MPVGVRIVKTNVIEPFIMSRTNMKRQEGTEVCFADGAG